MVQGELQDAEARHEAGHAACLHQAVEDRLQEVCQPVLQSPLIDAPYLCPGLRAPMSDCQTART